MADERERRGPEDEGWDALAQAWQQIAPPRLEQAPAELRRTVRRADLRFRLLAVLEVVLYLALIGLVIVFLRERKGPAAFLWGFVMMGFVAWGLDFAVRSRQGVWQAADQTTAAWLDLLAARCARKRRYARVSWLMLGALYAAIGALLVGFRIWLPADFDRVADRGWLLAGWLAAMLGVQYLWSTWYLRRVAAEEREIAALRGAPDDAG